VADVLSYYSEAILKFIVGDQELTDDSWQNYVDTLNAYGLGDVLAVYQNAYDEHLAGDR
jgi:hypothetical protein